MINHFLGVSHELRLWMITLGCFLYLMIIDEKRASNNMKFTLFPWSRKKENIFWIYFINVAVASYLSVYPVPRVINSEKENTFLSIVAVHGEKWFSKTVSVKVQCSWGTEVVLWQLKTILNRGKQTFIQQCLTKL